MAGFAISCLSLPKPPLGLLQGFSATDNLFGGFFFIWYNECMKKQKGKIKVTKYQGNTPIETYPSMSECARQNNCLVQTLYAHIKLRTLFNGFLFIAEGIEPDLEWSKRNHRKQKERESARNTPFSEIELSRWVALIPEQYRKGATKFIRSFAKRNSRTIKEAFAVWYISQDKCYIPSDIIASM